MRESLKLIKLIFENKSVKDFFETQINIYTLHALFDIEKKRTPDVWTQELAAFVAAYREDEKKEQSGDNNLAEFRKGASSRTRSRSSRSERVFGLRNWIRNHLGEPIKDKAD